MTNTTFCGAAFSYGIILSLSQHPARTDFSSHRMPCFNEASRLIPEMQFLPSRCRQWLRRATQRLGHPAGHSCFWKPGEEAPRCSEAPCVILSPPDRAPWVLGPLWGCWWERGPSLRPALCSGAGGGWLLPRGYRSRWLSPERCECHLHATVLEETIAKKGRCWQRIRRYGPARSSPGCREGAGCCCHGELGLVSMPDRGVGIPRVSWWCHRPGAGGRGRVGEQHVPKQCHPAAAGRDPHPRRGRGGQEGARSLTGL